MATAVSYLESQEARGGTSLQPAIATAYKYGSDDRPLNAVILSDGMTDQGERRILMDMIGSRPTNVRVFCIGVGNDINRSLLRQMAEEAGGLAAFISRGDDFERQAKAFRRKLMHPVATNLKIDISGVKVYDVEPQTLPNLYHGMPVRIYGRYKGDGKAQIDLSAEVNGRQLTTTATLNYPGRDEDNPEIERMWAWHRMERLKRMHEINNRQEQVDEIVRLGEGYSITSEYTSFLVLENDGEYQRWKIERRNASRIKRDRAAQQRVRQELEALRTQAMSDIGPQEPIKADQPQVVPVVAQKPSQNRPQGPASQPAPASQRSSSRSFDMPRFNGGGAMDPISVLIALALGGGVFLQRRKNR